MPITTKDINVKKIKPCGYHIVVELLDLYEEDEDGYSKTDGGILLTAATADREKVAVHIATVLDMGKFAFKNQDSGVDSPADWGVKIGDKVCFNAYVGKQVSSNPKDRRRLIIDHDIKAVVEME